jgi:hypothetical protein
VYLGYQISQLSISHRFPNTHNNPSTHLSCTQPVPPQENGPPPFSATQSLMQFLSFILGPPTQLVQNIKVGTLRTRSCEKNGAQANASQICRPQVTARSHQRPLQPTIPWLILQQFGFLPQANMKMSMDQ